MTERVHRRGQSLVILRVAMRLAPLAVSVALGYVILARVDFSQFFRDQQTEKTRPERIIQPEPPPPIVRPDPPVRRKSIPTVKAKSEVFEPPDPVPTPNPFAELPKHIGLPNHLSTTPAVILVIGKPVQLSLLANSEQMSLDDGLVTWRAEKDDQSHPVASLQQEGSSIVFAWSESPPDGAVTFLANSVLLVSSDEFQAALSLREPIVVMPFKFDLTKAKQRIICKCDHMPRAETIRFEFSGEGRLPQFNVSGADPHKLQIREEAILSYAGQEKVGTKLSMRRRGNTIVVEVTSRFALPSGDEDSLSVHRGKKKRRELEELLNSADQAAHEISELRSYLGRLRSELSQWQNMRTTYVVNGVTIQDPVLTGERANGIANTNRKISATIRDIERAQYLIKNRPAMQKELESLDRISQFAQQLEDSGSVPFRFYAVVEDREVDLVLSQ